MKKYTLSFLFTASLPVLMALVPAKNMAHESMIIPKSRVYNCYLNNPENPRDPTCAAAKAVRGSQPFYDWNGIN
ncbi:lytic polysaccharide monooxygenase, partial [Microbulbifer sp. 2205BS26-8]|uniref:lytic polysaccharide monooxygenase n=1 Tax=Microbulbifer sp. 2205BS26-8 TaxID=3064386 RepID=UPI00273EE9D6